jgi:hypothetical protein
MRRGDALRERLRLGLAAGRQRSIVLALPAALLVQCGFAVADEEQLGHPLAL